MRGSPRSTMLTWANTAGDLHGDESSRTMRFAYRRLPAMVGQTADLL